MNLESAQIIVRKLARSLSRAKLVTAFGHCSVRLDEQSLLVCAAKPPGLISVGEPGTVVPINGELPEGVLGEVRIHQKIYASRSDVNSVCRFLSPQVMALAAMGRTPKPRHGFGSYFSPEVPFWRDPALIRTNITAEAAAMTLGNANALVIGGNGAVTTGTTAAIALSLACFLEDAARVELAVIGAGMSDSAPILSVEQASERATWSGRIAERMWDYWTADDPEN